MSTIITKKGSNTPEIWGDGALDTYLNPFLASQRSTATKFLYRNLLVNELPLIQRGKYQPRKVPFSTNHSRFWWAST